MSDRDRVCPRFCVIMYAFCFGLSLWWVYFGQTMEYTALKAKQIDLLYAHKYWLFSLAGGIDCVIEVAQKSFSEWK